MHSECNHQKAREVGMSQQPQWDVWPSGSPDLPDSLHPEQEVTLLSSTEDCGKQIQLPKQLEAVRKASEFPFERHRWNTNEEVAAILIAFDKHESWEKQEVRTRPPSGTMLLYSRKKVRYRKDGYCWKKRKDGKTTREDHMKLKVQGIECIYGSYVHSAILPTFHRRCYWLLQNPDLVLVHYLNVPLTDDNKICLPPILQVDCKDWSHDDLVSQLRPMFASVKHFESASSVNETAEDAIESLVKHILGNSAGGSSGSNAVHVTTSAMPRTTVETLRNTSEQKMAPSSASNTMHSRLLQLIYSHKISPGAASASVPCVVGGTSGHQQMSPSQIGLAVCEPNNGTTVLRGLKSNVALSSGHKVSPHNGPLILNVSPLPGSKGLLILSSQAASTSANGTLSVLHQAPVANRIDVMTSKESGNGSRSLQGDYSDQGKKNFQPLFSGLGSESVRTRCESTAVTGKAAPCYGVVSDFLNHSDILGEFDDMQQVVKTEANNGKLRNKTTGHIPEFSSGSCVTEFSRGSCAPEPGCVDESDAHDLNQIGMDSMEFLFGDSGLADPPSSLISENDIKCEFYNFHESSSSDVGNHRNTEAIGSGVSGSCLTDTMDMSLAEHEKDLDDIKALHGNDLMMDELEDILHIVSESLCSSVDLTNTFSLSDDTDSSVAAMSSLYQCTDISGSSLSGSRQLLSVEKKLKSCLGLVQDETLSTNNDGQLFCSEGGKVGLLEITDYCPEWSYTEGGTKVLVTGPWHQTSSSYSVLFDDMSVPTSMVQGGVLRCFAPAHSPAVVCLRVAYNGQVISEPKVFEYKSRDQVETGNETDWFLVQDRQLKESLVQRFVEVEKCLMDNQAASLSTSLPLEVTESCLVGLVDQLAERVSALHCSPPLESPSRMTLLHLSAALGFNRLVSALIKWRNNNTCHVLEQEVDSLSVDAKGNTPLMWACARGHSEAVLVLAHWSPSSLHTSNKTNWRPTTILGHFGHQSIVELLQQINTSDTTSFLDSLTALDHPDDSFRQLLADDNFDGSSKSTPTDYLSLDEKQLFSGLSSLGNDAVIPAKREFLAPCDSSKDSEYWCVVDAPLQHSLCSPKLAPLSTTDVGDSDTCPPVLFGKGSGALKRTRLMKRTSVDILPDYPQFHNDLPKLSRTGAHPDGDEDGDTFEGQNQMVASGGGEHVFMGGLRASSSDPHLTNLERSSPLGSGSGGDPMISRIDRDLNSPDLFLQPSSSFDEDKGLSLEDIQRETVAMDMDSPDNLEGLSRDDGSEMLQSASVEADDHSNQMMTLANQIIAAMPERIKISPSHSKHLLMDEINSRRDRTSSYGSFSSCSSSTPPVCITEDSGISTPLEGMSFLEYRCYSDTPTSTLSPTSTCMQSPYSFGLDSPPPTTAEFTEYFNAPAMYMEKDFSQLTLSDEEQRRLYEAAKIIQNFYRKYKDKKEQQMRQQQKEIEAAILIQSYYRRYKQFMYYKRMTQAAVLIQSQFRSYYAQKCFRRSREAATIIQNRYRAYKEHERYKKSRNAAVIIQQRFRSHYQRTLAGRQSSLASTVHKMMADSDVSSNTTDAREPDIGDSNRNQNSSEQEENRVTTDEDVKTNEIVTTTAAKGETSDCSGCAKDIAPVKDDETQRL